MYANIDFLFFKVESKDVSEILVYRKYSKASIENKNQVPNNGNPNKLMNPLLKILSSLPMEDKMLLSDINRTPSIRQPVIQLKMGKPLFFGAHKRIVVLVLDESLICLLL